MFVPIVAVIALLTMTLVAPVHWCTRALILIAVVGVCVALVLKHPTQPTRTIRSLLVQHPGQESNQVKRPGPVKQVVEQITKPAPSTTHVSVDSDISKQEQRHKTTPIARKKELADQLIHRQRHSMHSANPTAAAQQFAELQNEGLFRDDKYA